MSNIEWTDATWNPVVGCTPVSPGCLNCYAATMARRLEGMGKKEYQPRAVGKHSRNCICGGTGAVERDGIDRTCMGTAIRIAEVKAGRAVFTGLVRTVEERLGLPLTWRKSRRVFVNSMSDLFHEDVPFEFVDRVFAVMALTPRHTYQILTKRPERMAEYLALGYAPLVKRWAQAAAALSDNVMDFIGMFRGVDPLPWPLPNVWLGASAEDQARADERIPHLLKCPAAVRFLSCEPLLGAVELSAVPMGRASLRAVQHMMRTGSPAHVGSHSGTTASPKDYAVNSDGTKHGPGVDWVIAGGESGPKARPCNVEWIRSIVAQCKAAGVPVFVKQLGSRPCLFDEVRKHAYGAVAIDVHALALGGWKYAPKWLKDRKGGDPAEWPEDLRVRQFPEARTCP